MALPLRTDHPQLEEFERIFRPVRGEDGELRILELPATLENLLDPHLEDQLTQSNRHLKTLVSLFDALKRYLERLSPQLAVFSDLMLLYKRHGERDLSPDIAVVEGLADRDAVDESLDVIAEGARLRLVMEVVSTSTNDLRKKDEEVNPDLFAKLGVEDYVLVYPPKHGKPLRVEAQQSALGRFRPNPPDGRGRILLRSVDLWLWVDEAQGRLVLEHRETGERLLTSEEEEAARRQEEVARQEAESRAAEADVRVRAETLIEILGARSLPVPAAARSRILACRDVDELKSWTRRALTIDEVDDLWGEL